MLDAAAAGARMSWLPTHPRVAVLGAGLAGLAAATQLSQHGCDVIILEGRNRVGGRVWSEQIATGDRTVTVERGAEFVLQGYDAFRQMLTDVDADLVDTGMSYYVRDVGDMPNVETSQVTDLGRRAMQIAETLSDAASADDVLRYLDDDVAVDALRARIEISTAAPATDVSATALRHIASLEPLPSWRVAGGNQRLPQAMAHRLGNIVHLGDPARRVIQHEFGVTVSTTTSSLTVDAVVVALPLAVLRNRSTFDMHLPAWKREALERVVQGHAAKLHLPLAGTPDTSSVMSTRGRFWTWTARDASGAAAPVLNCFMGSAAALTAYLDEGAAVGWTDAVKSLRSDLRFADTAPLLTTWADDPFAGGAYSARGANAQDADTDALAKPVGAVYFAGEYADADFTGLMEGAVRSGLRAAEQIGVARRGTEDSPSASVGGR
ncbi:flavin monoamine oxidase family protein [Jatrophihabitans sp. YIM 134969]